MMTPVWHKNLDIITYVNIIIIMLLVQFSSGDNYHKLYLNTDYNEVGNKAVTQCSKRDNFTANIMSINIFQEDAKTIPCYCVLHHPQLSAMSDWNYTYYTHNKAKEKFRTDNPHPLNGCSPIYFSVINNTINITYAQKKDMQAVTLDLPLRIVTDKAIKNIMLLCQNNQINTDNLNCQHMTTETTSHFTTYNSQSTAEPSMMSKTSNNNQLKIILLAVLIPIVLITIGLVIFIIYKKRYKQLDNSAVLSDTIEVKQAKGKNTQLKIHNYENVHRPTVIEVVKKSENNANASNHDYENVYKPEDDVAVHNNGSIYSKVTKY